MPSPTRIFRIFVSSTFSDLKAERNALQEHVYPRLRKLCQAHGAHFQAIDLRWGVSDEASIDQQTMKICLGEIERCQKTTPRPNFIVLLGDRYGWRPLPSEIPETEFKEILKRVTPAEKELLCWREDQPQNQKGWYRRDNNSVPPVYCLQARTGEFEDYKRWEQVEQDLRTILHESVSGLTLTPDERMKYGASATEQEILKGALGVQDAKEHVFCFFRRIERLPLTAKDFVDIDKAGNLDNEAHTKLENLKDKLHRLLSDNVYDYHAVWTGNDTTTDHVSRLCDDIYDSLSQIMLQEITKLEKVDLLTSEIQYHDDFGKDRANPRFFTGRKAILQTIADYLNRTDNNPLAVFGASGSGKSALMARAVAEAQSQHHEAVIVFRYIGATPESSNGRSLLESLCRQISRLYGVDDATVPTEYLKLVQDFPERLKSASEEKPLFLFLDALDQLSDIDNARNLAWLPELPEHVRIVVSTLPEPYPCLPVLKSRLPAGNLVELEMMQQEEGRALLEVWLADAGRTLQDQQRDEVLSKFAISGLPLYLRLAFEESRRWKSCIEYMPLSSDIPGIIRDLFSRLSDKANHGEVLVARSLGYLGAAKNGLTEDELLDVLSQDVDVYKKFLETIYHTPPDMLACVKKRLGEAKPDSEAEDWIHDLRKDPRSLHDFLASVLSNSDNLHLPVILWSRFYFDIKPYLNERSADGTSLLAFFHRQFSEVVSSDFLAAESKRERHRALAYYFGRQPHMTGINGKQNLNFRKLSELPYQQRNGEMWDELKNTLCDLSFIEAKCAAGMTYDLVADYNDTLASKNLPQEHRTRIEEFARFVRSQSYLLAKHPVLTFQQAFNEPDSTAPAQAARQRVAEGQEIRPHLRWINKLQSPSFCLNTFVGHKDIVNSCDVSSDGTRIVSASSDKDLKIWNENGKELLTLRGHGESVETCSFSPDRKRIVSGARNGEVKLWDAISGREVFSLGEHKGAVPTCVFSPDGKLIVSTSYDRTLRIWDAGSGKRLKTLRGNRSGVLACAFSQDGSRFVSGAGDGSLRLLSTITWKKLKSLEGHKKSIFKCVFSPDGKWIFSASEDGTLKRWDATTLKILNIYKGHTMPVWTLAISSDGTKLVSGSQDKTLMLWEIPTGRQIARLTGHDGEIWGLAFFPDNTRVISASWDLTLKVWDTAAAGKLAGTSDQKPASQEETLEELQAKPSHEGPIISCNCSLDGTRFAAGRSDGSLGIWDADKGSALGTFSVHQDYVLAVTFSADGKWILSGGWNGALKLFDATAQRDGPELPGHENQILACAFSHDGKQIISCSSEKIQFWDVDTTDVKLRFTLSKDDEPFQTCALAPDGKWFIVGSADGKLSLWDVAIQKKIASFSSHAGLRCCTLSPDATHLVSASSDGTLKLWDVLKRTEIVSFQGHAARIDACNFSPDGRRIVSASWDHTLKIWDIDDLSTPVTLVGHTDQLQDGCFSSDGKKILSVGMDGTFRLWDARTGSQLGLLVSPSNSVTSCSFSPDGVHIASASHKGALKLWDGADGTEKYVLHGHEGEIRACAFSPDGMRLLSASSDKTLKLWDVVMGKELATLSGHLAPVQTCAFSPDGRQIASGAWDKTVRIWDAKTGALQVTLIGHEGWVQQVLFSPDGKLIASCSQDKTLKIWEVATGKLLSTLAGHRNLVEVCAFSPDGSELISGSGDGVLKIWGVQNGANLCTLTGHTGAIRSCAFSPDGSYIVSASMDRTIRLWDVHNSQLRHVLSGHEGWILTCAFSPDGKQLVSGSEDRFLKLWNITTGKEICEYWAGVSVQSVSWHPASRRLAAGDGSGRLHLIELEGDV